jgi:DNA mismatch endonuclease (patch repair protein)
MRANRRSDTKPELALRRALHALGFRYRKDYRLDLAGARVRPDIAFTARRVAVFVDGCFWHCCPEHGTQPANNTWYWGPKLTRNVERDQAADAALTAADWQVVRIWEHETVEAAVARVVGTLQAAAPAPARQHCDPARQDLTAGLGSTPDPAWQDPTAGLGSTAIPPGSTAIPPGRAPLPRSSAAGPRSRPNDPT